MELSAKLFDLLVEMLLEFVDFAFDNKEKYSTILHQFLNFELKIWIYFYVFSRIVQIYGVDLVLP